MRTVVGRTGLLALMLACVGLPGCVKDCPANLEIVPATLPTGKVGQEYRVQLGLEPALSFAFWSHSGTLPPGLQFDVNSGLIEGTLTVAGTFQFRIAVGASCDPNIYVDSDSIGAARDYEVVVEP